MNPRLKLSLFAAAAVLAVSLIVWGVSTDRWGRRLGDLARANAMSLSRRRNSRRN